MKLKNILIVVNDIELSKKFYKNLFGLHVVMDMGENVILTEGLVLQERKLWESFTGKSVTPGGHDAELYFEENNMNIFLEKLQSSDFKISYVNPVEDVHGQRVVRLYDPDMHVIEVKEV
ncbi:MAG: glyoxalase [Tyzzerella sp.]|nr:glyoxalase [Tyzzerella sp.]